MAGPPAIPTATADPAVIDVIIAAWNRSETIERAILSVVREPAVRRVFVIDDASDDDTADRADAVAASQPKVRVFRSSRNAGPAAARNRALSEAKAPWVTILDADDYMVAGRLQRMLDRAEGWDLVADDLLQVPEDNDPCRGQRLLGVDASWAEQVTFVHFVRGNLPRGRRLRGEMGFLKPLMRRGFLDKHRLRYEETLRLGEDYILYARALAAGARFLIMPAAGYVSVMRGESLSGRHRRQDLEALLQSERAMIRLPGLGRAERRALRRHARHLEQKILWLQTIEAVKARRPAALIPALMRKPGASGYVAGQLLIQARRRLAGRQVMAR